MYQELFKSRSTTGWANSPVSCHEKSAEQCSATLWNHRKYKTWWSIALMLVSCIHLRNFSCLYIAYLIIIICNLTRDFLWPWLLTSRGTTSVFLYGEKNRYKNTFLLKVNLMFWILWGPFFKIVYCLIVASIPSPTTAVPTSFQLKLETHPPRRWTGSRSKDQRGYGRGGGGGW